MLYGPVSLNSDRHGAVYFSDSNTIRKLATQQIENGFYQPAIVQPFAGTGIAGSSGDEGPAGSAELNDPIAVWLDPSGQVYVGTRGDHKIRRIDTTGTIHAFGR